MTTAKRMFEIIRRAWALLVSDPVLFTSKLIARTRKALAPKSGTFPIEIGSITFQCEMDLDANVREMFVGNYEPEIVSILRRLLSNGDVAIDVGANIGYLSAVSLDLVGRTGQVHAFEPVLEMYERLLRVRNDNPEFALTTNNCALGERSGHLPMAITRQRNIGWNTMVPDFMESSDIKGMATVPVLRLDAYLQEHGIDLVKLIKIDTEGFEFPVLKGLTGFLQRARTQPTIIVEVAPSAFPKLGATLSEFAAFLREYNYVPRDLGNRHTVSILSLASTTNLLLVPATHGIA